MPPPDTPEQHAEAAKQASAGSDPASIFAQRAGDSLRLTRYFKLTKTGSAYEAFFCKPNKNLTNVLGVDREILALVADYPTAQPRTIDVAHDVIAENDPRLYPRLAIILHRDPEGDDKLAEWGDEAGVAILPLYAGAGSQLYLGSDIHSLLADRLYTTDAFQITGPVDRDTEFFGRRNDALELLRLLKHGRIHSLFGIRKVGKTSLINRVVTLARQDGSMNIAFIDCSLPRFHHATTEQAVAFLGGVLKSSTHVGYATLSDLNPSSASSLDDSLQALARQEKPTLIVLDEVDAISPFSGGARWQGQFVEFWQQVRALIQEAPRQGSTLSTLISGVASKPFRAESINGHENPVLHFVPDQYLGPFATRQATSMVGDLGKRCGLKFDPDAAELITSATGGFPFWIRMLGSFLHRSFETSVRPADVDYAEVKPLVDEFIESEGRTLAQVALRNLQRVYPEIVNLMQECRDNGSLPVSRARLLTDYGLAVQSGLDVKLDSAMVLAGLNEPTEPISQYPAPEGKLRLDRTEWAEELAHLNYRRNRLELSMRGLVRWNLKVRKGGSVWKSEVLRSLRQERRSHLEGMAADKVMDGLYWRELQAIVEKHWEHFQDIFGDKKRFVSAMEHLNERPDAHAQDIDAADVALYRRELQWLEERALE